MKKTVALFLLVFTFVQTVSSMIPGPPILVNCPKCGEEKKLMSIVSGNTIGSTQWSDAYQYAPMLPRLSPVQKCQECRNYFLLSEVEINYSSDDDFCTDTGILSFSEMKEALSQLEKDTLSRDDEIMVRLELLHRYNDAFRENYPKTVESSDNMFRNEEDRKCHLSNLHSLIALLDSNYEEPILVAELYREAGDFSNCLSLIEAYSSVLHIARHITDQIKKRAEAEDDKVFEMILD